MTAPRTQYDSTLTRRARTVVRANLDRYLVAHNTELNGTMVLVRPVDEAIESRGEATVDERVLPQAVAGVWFRVRDIREVNGISMGEGRTIFGLESTTWINAQSYEIDSTVPTTAQDGYERCAQLARLVDDTLRAKLPGSAGVIYINARPGPRIPRVLRNMPSIHAVTSLYDVMMRTWVPCPGETMPTYGSWYNTSEDATQVVVLNVAEKIDIATTAGQIAGMTHTSPNALTNDDSAAGDFWVSATATVDHSVNNTEVHLQIWVNGSEVTGWEQKRFVATGGDKGNMSVRGIVNVGAAEDIEIYVEADKSGTITWEHVACTVQRVS